MHIKRPAVYMMANKPNGTLYTGVTSDLPRRAHDHRESSVPSFAARYGCKLLVWYEPHDRMATAIVREKQIKAGSRKQKLALIEAWNPTWRDLYEDLTYAASRGPGLLVASLLAMTAFFVSASAATRTRSTDENHAKLFEAIS
jgi:predicted GIY-YIG superfamily endonuclease